MIWHLYSKLTGKNHKSTPPNVIQGQLQEKRALPTGIQEFKEWSDRIISGSMLTADAESQRFALANTLINLSPTTAFETDLYFIHVLRKHAINQVADAMRTEIRNAAKERLNAEEASKMEKPGV